MTWKNSRSEARWRNHLTELESSIVARFDDMQDRLRAETVIAAERIGITLAAEREFELIRNRAIQRERYKKERNGRPPKRESRRQKALTQSREIAAKD